MIRAVATASRATGVPSAEPRRWVLPLPWGEGRRLELPEGGLPAVMGIVNITPDSFSDGGRFLEADRAVEHGLRLLEEGADLLDLGAESTRPGGGVYGDGAREVSPQEEMDRLLPVLERLRSLTAAPLSVDTRKGAVAAAALAAGADLINDISLLSDPALARAAAADRCPLILMHSRGDLATMQHRARYEDLFGEVAAELEDAMERAEAEGVAREQIILDPGIGFAKSKEHNVALIAHLDRLTELGRPLLLGASRKSFLGRLALGEAAGKGEVLPPSARLAPSLAAVARGAEAGAGLVRVHDVQETVHFLRVWRALR